MGLLWYSSRLLVLMFRKIHAHYMDVAQQLKLANYQSPNTPRSETPCWY